MSNVTSSMDNQPVIGTASGGTTGQVLSKKSNLDYDTEWVSPNTGTVTSFTVSHNNIGQIDSVVTDKKTYTMTYDSLNRLDTVSDGTTTIQCQYNDYGQFTGTVTV